MIFRDRSAMYTVEYYEIFSDESAIYTIEDHEIFSSGSEMYTAMKYSAMKLKCIQQKTMNVQR